MAMQWLCNEGEKTALLKVERRRSYNASRRGLAPPAYLVLRT